MAEPDRVCVVCGRRIEWRKKWSRDWTAVRYCSDRCRRHKLTPKLRSPTWKTCPGHD